jgi:DNA-binding response OmpR family regulator
MTALEGKNILVVEDEALLALDISQGVEKSGATVTGPCMTFRDALAAAEDQDLNAAILDVDLNGRDVFEVADLLIKRAVPFVFHTGRSEVDVLRQRYAEAPICEKPARISELVYKLSQILGY